MKNFKFTVQYEGTRYDGWQRQGNTANTIQGKLEHVLQEMTGHAVEVHGAGRTDAGVHARAQIAHCKLNTAHTAQEIRDYCNQYLSADIAVIECAETDMRFHAQLNAKGKRYIYRLWTGKVPNVFERKYLCAWPEKPDLKRMRDAAALLKGTHDFRAFCSNKRLKKSSVRTISQLDISQHGDELRFVFEGDGFLYNMIRIITGTLVEIGQGKRAAADIPAILDSCERAAAGLTMPPQGLILDEVFYNSES